MVEHTFLLLEAQHHTADQTQRSIANVESLRRSSMELLESKCKDQSTIMAKVVEVKTQEALNTMNFAFEELERKLQGNCSRLMQDSWHCVRM